MNEWVHKWVEGTGLEKPEQCQETWVLSNTLTWHDCATPDAFLSSRISFSPVKLQGGTKFFQAGKVWALFLRVTGPFWCVNERDIKGPRFLECENMVVQPGEPMCLRIQALVWEASLVSRVFQPEHLQKNSSKQLLNPKRFWKVCDLNSLPSQVNEYKWGSWRLSHTVTSPSQG